MSLYTIVSCKLTHALVRKQLGSRKRQLGKTAVVKVRAYIVSMDRKTTVYRLETGEVTFSAYKLAIAMHVPFTGLTVSWSLYCLYSSRAELHISVWYNASPLQLPLWCNNQSLVGKQPVRIKSPLTQIQYLREVPGFPSVGHN